MMLEKCEVMEKWIYFEGRKGNNCTPHGHWGEQEHYRKWKDYRLVGPEPEGGVVEGQGLSRVDERRWVLTERGQG